jgi:hypothetical protein
MRCLLLLLLPASLAGHVGAQRLAVYDPPATGGPGFLELTAPTPLMPPGSPPVVIYPGAPILPPPPPALAPPGDSSFNGITGLNWYTNGMFVASTPTPDFPPAAPPMPPAPVPPAVLAMLGGPVTGLAIAPAGLVGGILWLVSGPGIVVGVAPVPAMPVVVPPFPIPFALMGPVSGLDWDAMTGTLLAVDILGFIYPFAPPGVPTGPPIGPPVLPPMGIVNDVAIDKSGNLNPVAVRGLYIVAGPMVYDATTFVPPPLPAGTPMATGLAFVPHPAAIPPMGVCPCATFPGYGTFTTGPMTAGNLGFGLGIAGIPPGQIALFALDFAFNPLFPLFNGVGCGLGMIFGSPTLVSSVLFATPAGTVTFPLPLVVPPGFGPIYYQAGTLCPADPVGLVITPMLELHACGL